MKVNLMKGDCLELMKTIPDGSVDMILTDPPYGTMKGIEKTNKYGKKEEKKHNWDETLDHEKMLNECNRILRENGCLCLFSQDPYTGKLMTETHNNLPFSYRLTWKKDNFANSLIAKKAPVNYTEDVNLFFKKYENKKGHPLQKYFIEELKKTNYKTKDICKILKTQHASHFFTNGIQFRVPNEKYLKQLQETTGRFLIKYEEVSIINKKFNQEKRDKFPKVFNLWDGKKYKSNVLEYKKDYQGLHPTQKPVLLLEDLIKTYTNEGMTVLDFTAGSFSTGIAAINTNRNFIGIELNDDYFEIGKNRINEHLKNIGENK